MTPFQVFRRWCRRAPLIHRAAAATAAALVLGAMGWAVAPNSSKPTAISTALGGPGAGIGQPAGAASTAGGPLTAVPAPTSGGATATGASPTGGPSSVGGTGSGIAPGTPGATASATGTGTGGASGAISPTRSSTPSQGASPVGAPSSPSQCVSPPGGSTGVSAKQIKIAIILVNIAGAAANSTFGIESPQAQQAAYQAAIDNINANGGVACRTLVPDFFTLDPVDQNGLQQACLSIAQAGVFAVLDAGAYANYATGLECYAQNHIAIFESYDYSAQEVQQLYPYLFAVDTLDSAYKDSVFGLKQEGFFSPANGFKKLGLIYRNCYPSVVQNELSWLAQAGVSSSEISSYNMGCPSTFASPSDLENAIIQFQQAGVTNMTEVDELGDMATFTSDANTQHFDPKWGLADDGLLEISSGAEAPNSSNLNGAIAIAASRDGENTTPGFVPSAGTVRCNAVFKAAGLASVYSQAPASGNACDQLWMLQDAMDNAPALVPTALVNGLQRTGSIDFSYPQGQNNFTAPGTTYGGQYWRVDHYLASCSCWQVTSPNWNPSF